MTAHRHPIHLLFSFNICFYRPTPLRTLIRHLTLRSFLTLSGIVDVIIFSHLVWVGLVGELIDLVNGAGSLEWAIFFAAEYLLVSRLWHECRTTFVSTGAWSTHSTLIHDCRRKCRTITTSFDKITWAAQSWLHSTIMYLFFPHISFHVI